MKFYHLFTLVYTFLISESMRTIKKIGLPKDQHEIARFVKLINSCLTHFLNLYSPSIINYTRIFQSMESNILISALRCTHWKRLQNFKTQLDLCSKILAKLM